MNGILLVAFDPFFFIILIGGFLLFAGGALWSHLQEKKRRETLAEVADEMQLKYLPEGDPDLQAFFTSTKLCSTGRARKLTNLIEGETDEVEIAIFDYQYTTGGGKNQHTSKQSVAALRSNFLMSIPSFWMRPESMLDKIGGAVGFQDFDFESHPNFSGMFVLQGQDETAVRDFFTPTILEFFEDRPGISLQTVPGGLLFYRAKKRVRPDEFKDLLSDAYEIFGLMIDGKS